MPKGGESGYASSSRWQVAREVREQRAAASMWYFGFGANINPWKLREKRKIIPIEQVPGKLPGWRLSFNHKGGMGNIEQLDSPTLTNPGPDEVHGMLLHLTSEDFSKLSQIEYEYSTTDVRVAAYDGREILAKAFVTPPEWKLSKSVAPPERYLKLIRDGCDSMGIAAEYQQWLKSLDSSLLGPRVFFFLHIDLYCRRLAVQARWARGVPSIGPWEALPRSSGHRRDPKRAHCLWLL